MRTSLGPLFPPERIKTIRLALGMTLKEAGARVGVPGNTWGRWERDPSLKSAARPSSSACVILEKMEGEAKYRDMKRVMEKGE